MSALSTDQPADAGVVTSREADVLTVTLDRPQVRNAQTPAMWRALASVGAAIEPDVRAVVLRGSGESFSAGLDRRMLSPDGIPGEIGFADLAALPDDELDVAIGDFQAAFTWWRNPQFVSVALVHGHAVGAGFQLALACDLRVVSDDAKFCMRETALGLVPDLGGTKPLVEAVGYAKALEICATGRWVGASEAVRIGLATVAVEPAGLDATVDDLVDALTTPPRGAVSALKGLLQGAVDRSYADQLASERAAQADRIRQLVRDLGRA